MIEENWDVFPNNVVAILATRFQLLDSDLFVTRRPLRESDPVQCIGIFPALWTPNQESLEIRGIPSPGPQEPTLQRYAFAVQAFVKDMDEERGSAKHSTLSKMVLLTLYRDNPLHVALAALSSSMLGATERTRRWGITTQRFLNNQLDSEWLYLSTVEIWLETETN